MNVQIGDRLVSNNGRGPLEAEVVSVGVAQVVLDRWDRRSRRKRRTRFKLEPRFLQSRACGWKKAN